MTENERPDWLPSWLSLKAYDAIQDGVAENDNVCDLELLGLSQRIINSLEEAEILTLKDLLSKDPSQLLGIRNFGEAALAQVFETLGRYDELKSLRASYEVL